MTQWGMGQWLWPGLRWCHKPVRVSQAPRSGNSFVNWKCRSHCPMKEEECDKHKNISWQLRRHLMVLTQLPFTNEYLVPCCNVPWLQENLLFRTKLSSHLSEKELTFLRKSQPSTSRVENCTWRLHLVTLMIHSQLNFALSNHSRSCCDH